MPPPDKAKINRERLRVRDGRGQTVEPVTDDEARRPAAAHPSNLVVHTEWSVVPDAYRRARLLAALFGEDAGGGPG